MENATTDTNTEATIMTEVAAADQEAVQATESQETSMGWSNVEAVGGVEISIFGMAIVFIGLILTFCYISLLPYVAGEKKLIKRKEQPESAKAPADTESTAPKTDGLTPELQAAIAFVIAAEQEYQQLTDYTKLTIRRDENHQVWGVAGKMRTLATRKISTK